MSQDLNQLRLCALAAVIAVATASQAFAQQPGESNSYTNETINKGRNLQSSGTLAEARNGGNQLDVWRSGGYTDQVWMSLNHGAPFQVGRPTTRVSPAVAAFGPNSFFIVYTGMDNRIYYTVFSGNGESESNSQWFAIPNQTTPSDMSVSVAPIGEGSRDEFVVFRGSGNDTAVYSTWLNDAGNWSNGVRIPNAFSSTGPAVCLNNTAKSLWVAFIGTDNQINTITQPLGAKFWSGPTPRKVFTGINYSVEQGILLPSSPSCAATANGNVALAYVDVGKQPNYAVFNSGGTPVTEWTKDITGWLTDNAVRLTSSGDTVWSLFTGRFDEDDSKDDITYWKQVYDAR